MLTVCIHQPDFLPHLAFFERLLFADHFIYLDDVQFIRRGWQHRDRIKNKSEIAWLTLSLQKGDYFQQIKDVLLSPDGEWIDGNLNLIRNAYYKTAYFHLIFPVIEEIYRSGYAHMIDLNVAFLNWAMSFLEINIKVDFSSKLKVSSTRNQRLIDLVLAVSGNRYITGSGSVDYLDETLFDAYGIEVIWQNFNHPIYSQLHGDFVPMLSCIDLFFNCGKDSAEILRGKINQ